MSQLWKDWAYKESKVKGKSHLNNKSAEQQNKHKVTAYIYAEEPELEMFSVWSDTEKQPFWVNFTVNQQDLLMEIDTGAAVSIISQQVYKQSFAHLPLEGARVKLKTYTSECIPVLGSIHSCCAIWESSEWITTNCSWKNWKKLAPES